MRRHSLQQLASSFMARQSLNIVELVGSQITDERDQQEVRLWYFAHVKSAFVNLAGECVPSMPRVIHTHLSCLPGDHLTFPIPLPTDVFL